MLRTVAEKEVTVSTKETLCSDRKVRLDESGISIEMDRWADPDQQLVVRVLVKFKDGASQEFVSGVRSGGEKYRHGVLRGPSVYSVKFMAAGRNGAKIPDPNVDSITATLEPVKGSPTVTVRAGAV